MHACRHRESYPHRYYPRYLPNHKCVPVIDRRVHPSASNGDTGENGEQHEQQESEHRVPLLKDLSVTSCLYMRLSVRELCSARRLLEPELLPAPYLSLPPSLSAA